MTSDEYRIDTESPAGPDLMFWTVVGHEALSQPSTYEMRVLSKRNDIAPKEILGHAFDLVLGFDDADGGTHERHCKGHAVRFSRRGAVGRYFEYSISLRSWFWLLEKRVNSRIFQGQTVLQAMDAVIEDGPIRQLKKVKPDGVIGEHKKRPYCVQHQESDFQFISRLLEEEGIYYWFDAHDAPGTMYLSDASDLAHQPLPAAASIGQLGPGVSEPRFNEFRQLIDASLYASGKYASHDIDFKAIRKPLRGSNADAAEHELSDLEVFEYPGGYFRDADSDKAAKVRMEELAARRKLYWAITPWADVAVGRRTKFHSISSADDIGTEQLIVSCLFVVTHPGYEGTDTSSAQNLLPILQGLLEEDRPNAEHLQQLMQIIGQSAAFTAAQWGSREFLITSVPISTPFRPPRVTPRVRMPGPQTAIVVGPEGKEIYADDLGRVKVHFPWDRYDHSNEKSTCWVRVSQPWAGKGWGGYFIPRVGQEVIVDFLNGDPDRPIIVGRMYNDDQPIPFKSHTQSGFRTRSTPKGNASNFNEFRFDDEKGKEQVFLHAEKNQDIEVEADETHWVGHDRKKTIDNDENVEVKNNRTEKVGVDEKITIGSNRTEQVGANEKITIGSNRTESVGVNETVTIGANRDLTVAANETITVGANRTDTVGAGVTQTVGAAMTQSIGAGLTQTIGAAWSLTAGGPVTITAPAGFTLVAPGGTNIVDFQLCQVGGTIKEGYASKLDFNVLAMEANAAKIEATGSSNALIGFKFERVGADVLSKGMSVAQMDALAALSCATNIEMDTLKLIL